MSLPLILTHLRGLVVERGPQVGAPDLRQSTFRELSGEGETPHSERPGRKSVRGCYQVCYTKGVTISGESKSGDSCTEFRYVRMDTKSKPTVLDLFCGAGGFSCGFEQAGFEILAGLDKNEAALETYSQNHDAEGYKINLRELTPEEVFDELGLRPRDVDVVIGGPPCQGHSPQGKQNPDDERNELMGDYLSIIDYASPRAFVMENVSEIQDTWDGEFIQQVIDRVEEMGYNLTSGVLHGGDYHVPQTRDRFILVGLRDGVPTIPEPVGGDPIPVWAALSGLPLMDHLPNNDWEKQLEAHRDGFREKYDAADVGADPYANSDQQVRLAPMRPARTVVADNSHCHPTQPRYLTVREAACLQTFPLEYRFYGGVVKQREQVGNAVPPKMAKYIAEEVRESLTNVTGQTTLTDHGFALSD